MSKFRQPSVMKSQTRLSQVPAADIPRSKFDRSHGLKTTFDSGLLIPVFVDEVLPGDTFHMNSTAFARLATPLHPIMDNMFLDVHYWFVPNRLVWENWQQFMGERPTPSSDPNDFVLPKVELDIPQTPSDDMKLAYYFGLPRLSDTTSGPANVLEVNALPFRAYNLIYNEWYRDQNLQNPANLYIGDDTESDSSFSIRRRGKRKDYFTGALPWPQKGDPVTIPFGVSAPVYGVPDETPFDTPLGVPVFLSGQDADNESVGFFASLGSPNFPLSFDPDQEPAYLRITEDRNALFADLSDATAISINDLRTAFQIQKLLERDARGGTRYIELIQSHFGVTSDDARLQRPEYLGGGTSRINIHPTQSTVATEDAPQGNLAAFATTVGDARFTKSFTEHGHIIGICSARADLTYQRGVERFWSRTTRYDYYWPALAHLGEQAILNKEINYRGDNVDVPTDEGIFGYQERYAEYRYKPSRITGLFNSDTQNSLDVWHLAQDFSVEGAVPLNSTFISEDPPVDRVIAVPSEPHFIMDMWFDLKCDRPMPVYSVPGLIDHF